MKGYIGVTDNDWFEFVWAQVDPDEVNFWHSAGEMPSGGVEWEGELGQNLYFWLP